MEHLFFETKIAIDDAGAVSGIAWPFGEPDRVGDAIEPKAFANAVGKSLPMLWAHDGRDTIGIWDQLKTTARGFEVQGRMLIDEVARAKEVRAMVKSGAARGLSIGFMTKSAKSRPGGRTITAIDLVEVSIVSTPMHPAARITNVKSFDPTQAGETIAALNRAAQALRA